MTRTLFLIAVAALIALPSLAQDQPTGWVDQLVLKNSNRITGTIIGENEKEVIILVKGALLGVRKEQIKERSRVELTIQRAKRIEPPSKPSPGQAVRRPSPDRRAPRPVKEPGPEEARIWGRMSSVHGTVSYNDLVMPVQDALVVKGRSLAWEALHIYLVPIEIKQKHVANLRIDKDSTAFEGEKSPDKTKWRNFPRAHIIIYPDSEQGWARPKSYGFYTFGVDGEGASFSGSNYDAASAIKAWDYDWSGPTGTLTLEMSGEVELGGTYRWDVALEGEIIPAGEEPIGEAGPTPGGAAPATGRIVFVDKDHIVVSSVDGTGRKDLTGGKIPRAHSPVWSPDGSQIAFIAGNAIPSTIFIVNADGSELREIRASSGGSGVGWLGWSPEGRQLTFASGDLLSKDIYTIHADGSNEQNLTNNPDSNDTQPAWSPDGRSIAFVSKAKIEAQGGGKTLALGEISIIPSGGGSARALTQTEAQISHPQWSLDGGRILFVYQPVLSRNENVTQLGQEQMYLMELDGSGLQKVMEGGDHRSNWPAWAPDGERIAVSARPDGGPNAVYVTDIVGGRTRAVTPESWGHDYTWLSWTPDGSMIVAQDGSDIVVIQADGSGVAKLGGGRGPRVSPPR